MAGWAWHVVDHNTVWQGESFVGDHDTVWHFESGIIDIVKEWRLSLFLPPDQGDPVSPTSDPLATDNLSVTRAETDRRRQRGTKAAAIGADAVPYTTARPLLRTGIIPCIYRHGPHTGWQSGRCSELGSFRSAKVTGLTRGDSQDDVQHWVHSVRLGHGPNTAQSDSRNHALA